MPLNNKLIIYGLAKYLNSFCNVELCNATANYVKKKSKIFQNLEISERTYITNYALNLANGLISYLGEIKAFELNDTDDHEIIHDFRLIYKKKSTAYISIDHLGIGTKDIIPEKLMKICKFKKNSNIAKSFLSEYDEITNEIYKKIKDYEKYSDVSDKVKRNSIYKPICNLLIDSIGTKRKCAQQLYNHLFPESGRIMIKLYSSRFIIYDFGKQTKEITSYKMKLVSNNEVEIVFNNGASFLLRLRTNSPEIKKHISIKFKTTFTNMDDIFSVANGKIKTC